MRSITIITFTALLMFPFLSLSDDKKWPLAEKLAAVNGCRLSIIENAEKDYLKRHNLKQLPSGFRENIVPSIEPYLAICDCALNKIEQQWSLEYFLGHQADIPLKISDIMAGECANTPAAQQGVQLDH